MKNLMTLALGATLVLAVCATSAVNAQGYGNAYRNGYIPQGSYQQSCQDIQVRGNVLRAECQNPNGQYIRTRLELNQCNGRDIANRDGQLTCGRRGGYNGNYNNGNYNGNYNNGNYNGNGYYGNGVPGGSYQNSCSNIQMNGSVMAADCHNDRGNTVHSWLDLRNCGRSDIANVNGQLRCGGYNY